MLIQKLLTSIALLLAGVDAQTLAPKKYHTLPLGTVRSAGWLQQQLDIQTRGLAGQQINFYPFASNTDWTGGTAPYSSLEEAGSYWFNAMVPNAVLTNDTFLLSKVRSLLEYVLDHQEAGGWLGPEVGTSKPRYLWGRYPFFFGAIGLTEAFPEYTPRVVDALYRFTGLANTMLRSGGNANQTGVEPWTATRWEDYVMTLQWLFDNHPRSGTNQTLLIDTMQRLKYTGVPWEKVFATANFPTIAVDRMPNPFPVLTWHGVNMAEGLKALPSTYRFTKNQTDLNVASSSWDLLFRYHGRPSGIYNADEYLAGLEATRGSELCIVVEAMFSGSYLYQVIGDLKYADRVERITYNALPATLTAVRPAAEPDRSEELNPSPWAGTVIGPYSNVFGLEPNYPCCTVNFGQGYPKFISNSFLTTPDLASLLQIYLGPFSTKATLTGGNSVTANVDTLYPFSDTLTTTITATRAFTWVVGGTIAINGGLARALSPSNGLQSVAAGAGTTTFVLNLPAVITVENRVRGSVAIHRGPLHYALDITRRTSTIKQNAQQPLAKDLQLDPTSSWQYAIDPSTVKFVAKSVTSLPSPVYDSGLPPFSITVSACLISWGTAGDTWTAPVPQSPVACTGARTTLTLTPYGATRLRISEFPVMRV
ncbi:hypothetical protein BDV98DRAFT_595510 [Pterulicium gracile]|uniref:Six-hairpin glycosidase-like protein n=1 Tax=Pterulicium gracile TaxID=1884261 RepID=A0A5C3Q9X7_9AGAR|nr:hypothetical protein BDV98DRAFT_595510 [Pterula gracilis]